MGYDAGPMEMESASREELVALVAEQASVIGQQRAAIERLEARVRELEGGVGDRAGAGAGKPRGLAGNKLEPKSPPKGQGERKRRERSFVRPRHPEPHERHPEGTRHAYDVCPGCGTGLAGGSVKRTREVIEVRPSPVVVTEHVYLERCCPYCPERRTPPAELAGVVVGKHPRAGTRLGVGLVSLIACLREVGRLPIDTIRWYLETVHGLSLSVGAIVGALGAVAKAGGGLLGERLLRLCAPYLSDEDAPQSTLCRRIEKYLGELYVFVSEPGVPPDNNLAERSLRPLVTARKISGGTRSPQGTDTKMTLANLFGTWLVRGLDPYASYLQMLKSPQP